MPSRSDAVIIGAGHNGLVAAYYLAKAGLNPLVLERRPVVGGCAITEEFHPGFKCSSLSHSDGPFCPKIRIEMELGRHGLSMYRPDPIVFAPTPQGRALLLFNEAADSFHQIERFSPKDAKKFLELGDTVRRWARVLARFLLATPPAIEKTTAGDLYEILKLYKGLRSLGKKEMLRLLRWIPMPIADFVAEWFESDLLRAVIAARAIFGGFLGPRSPGSTAIWLARIIGDEHPAGSLAVPHGGMGALTQALASAAAEAGAEIRTGAEVSGINVKNNSATGVVLASGEEIASKAVISNLDPPRTLLRLLDPIHLEPSFVAKLRNYRATGCLAKINLALSGLPTFTALEGRGTDHGALAARIHIGPETDYLERAFDAAKYGDFSPQPYLEATIPSVWDSSLAPPGRHVMSICAQFAPLKLKDADWNARRLSLAETVIKALAEYAPDLPGRVLHCQVITPLDLEETYGLTGGHIFHGELSLDQIYATRPLLGWAKYRTPIEGLYLCGSGTHPGTGLTGISGHNAARETLKDWKKLERT